MSKLKVIFKNRDFQSAFLMVSMMLVLVLIQEGFSLGHEVGFSLAPLAAMGYFISYRSGWRGVIMAILANAVMAVYVLSLDVQAFNLPRAITSLMVNAFGYCLIGWQSERLKTEIIRADYLGEVQLARFRAAFEQIEGHLLKVMTLIEMRKAVVEDEAAFILEQLKRAQSLLANQVTIAEVAHQLVKDKELLGLTNKGER